MTVERKNGLAVVQISAEYPPDPGGVGDYTRMLGRALIARGHRVVVLTGGNAAGATRPIVEQGDPPPYVATRDWSWRSIHPLLETIAEREPDIVHIQYQTGAYGMHPAINFLPGRIRRLPRRPRVVVTAHDLRVPYLLPKAGLLRRWVTRRLLVDADALIVTNAADRQALAGGPGQPDPDMFRARTPIAATVIPIGSNIAREPPAGYHRDEWRQRLGMESDDVVAYFGLASPTKGLLELVEAIADLPPCIRLLVVGGEARQAGDQQYAARVRATVEGHGLAGRVVFTGYCDPQTVSAHLLAADAGALPFRDGASYRRGSLLALLAHGLPLVTTHPETPLSPPLIDGEHALLVPVGATADLQAAITRLVTKPTLRARLSAGAQALHLRFTWPAIAAAHEDVYNALLER